MSDGVTVKINDPNGVIPALAALSKTIPKECERAQLRAASIMPRKITAAMRTMNLKGAGGPLPKLSDLSTALRQGKPGGKLTADKGLCRVMAVNGKLVAGFVGRVQNVAALWQEGGSKPVSIGTRHHMHIALAKRGARGIVVPKVAEQPRRMVVEPLAATFERDMPKWVLGAVNKQIDSKLARLRK